MPRRSRGYETPAWSREATKKSIVGSSREISGADAASSRWASRLCSSPRRTRRRAELDHDPARVVRVDRDAPSVVDADDIVAVREEAVLAGVDVVEVGRTERDVVDEVRETEAGRDRRVEVTEVVVVQIPERDELAVAGVVEEVARPSALEERDDVDLHELEAHRVGVEAVARFEVARRDRNVVESHAPSLPRCVHGFAAGPGDCRPRPARAVRAMVRRSARRRCPPTGCDDARDGFAERPSRGPHRAAAGPRRTRIRLLHEPGERQGARTWPHTRRPRSSSTGASSNGRCA